MKIKTRKIQNAFLLLMLCFFVGLSNVSAQQLAATPVVYKTENTAALVTWDKTQYDFGKIPHDIPATAEFILTNTSDKPLIIKDAKGSCGCTVPTWKKDMIAPGESTTIKATYNAKKQGKFSKSVTVVTNLHEKPIVLSIKGEVAK